MKNVSCFNCSKFLPSKGTIGYCKEYNLTIYHTKKGNCPYYSEIKIDLERGLYYE